MQKHIGARHFMHSVAALGRDKYLSKKEINVGSYYTRKKTISQF